MSNPYVDEKIADEKFIALPEKEGNAPEVAPLEGPQARFTAGEAEGLQVVETHDSIKKPSIDEVDTAEKAERSSQEEKQALGPATTVSRSKRKKWIWIGVASAIVVIIALAVGLGVGLGMKNNDDSSPTPTNTTATASPTPTYTSVPASLDPTATGHSDPSGQGCLEQANKNQSAICVPLPNDCPAGYRHVFWNWGCPDGENPEWRCCI